MLLVLNVPTRAVMEIKGWSQVSMTTRYQHSTAELVAGIAKQVGGLLGEPDEENPESDDMDPADGDSGAN
ncbi:hypothetical protein [Krasilnikovia sp. M28-CT-15]|uniref:hypothetical protein n=1 Tax=Krasilnikovia sp. M28-CT-15 TaxID=3373540 RepID=UPI00387652E5